MQKIDPKIDEEELKRQEEQRKADEEIQSKFKLTATFNKNWKIDKYIGSDNNIVIPTKFKGKSVEEIGVEAFKNLTIQTIFIPSSIKLISNFAFANSKLSNVNMHEGLITIETKAFANTKIQSINWRAKV